MKEPGFGSERKVTEGRIPGLDGLRGLTALTVMVSHMSNNRLFLLPGLELSGIGKPAVYLFFVLSAFLLTTQLWAWEPAQMRDGRRWLSYLLGRLFRIWPLFLLYVAVSFLTTRFGSSFLNGEGLPERYGVSEVIDTLLLRRVEGSILWTVLVEFKFYLLLPFFMGVLVLGLRKSVPRCLVVLTVSTAACLFLIPRELTWLNPIPYLGIFLTGMFGAVLHYRLVGLTLQRWKPYFELTAWLSTALFLLLIPSVASLLLGMPVPPEYLRFAYPTFSIMWLLLILGMLHGTGVMLRLLEGKALIRLGTISYGLYLCHMSVLKIVTWPRIPLPMGAKAWLGVAGALALATLTFRLVEAPALACGARLRRSIAHPRTGTKRD